MSNILNKRNIIIFSIVLLFTLIAYTFAGDNIDSGTRVEENSTLTYYLKIKYDGKNIQGVESNDTTKISVNSDIIHVTDTLPEGLTFNSFEGSVGQAFNAVERKDHSTLCNGYVINGYSGLKYDATTRTVSFDIKHLQAGCEITIGINTTTPYLNGKERLDFFNTAYGQENDVGIPSNTFHTFIGSPIATKYNVKYSYTGDVPINAPSAPITQSYATGSSVGVMTVPNIEGYKFSGFTCDATVSNNKFTMGTTPVNCTGSWSKLSDSNKNSVTYKINNPSIVDFEIPSTNTYYKDHLVKVDMTTPINTIINGYKFLGWTVEDNAVAISSDNDFVMPNTSVVLIGNFEEVKYNVTYSYQGSVLPTGSDVLIPSAVSYKVGDKVTLNNPLTMTGYSFNGWYVDGVEVVNNSFTMPDKNVNIYGSWTLTSSLFSPSITKTVVDKKASYKTGKVVTYNITVTNNATYTIKDVYVKESKGKFIAATGYSVETPTLAKINEIISGGSITLNVTYVVLETDPETITNTVEIIGAIADNNATLDTSKEYQAEANITKKDNTLTINNDITGNMADRNKKFTYKINFYNQENNPLSNSYTAKYGSNTLTISNGSTFTLGNNESLEIYNIPDNVKYKITETKDISYEVTINQTLLSNEITGTIISDIEVNYDNNYSQNIVTGMILKYRQYALLIIISIILIISYNSIKQKIKSRV